MPTAWTLKVPSGAQRRVPPVRVLPRVRDGGEQSNECETERAAFACMLGGEDGKLLFTCEADWLGRERIDTVIAKRAGKLRIVRRTRCTRATRSRFI